MTSNQGLISPATAANAVFPAPITRVSEAFDQADPQVPGEIELDQHGQLLRNYLTYEGFAAPLIEAYDNWITNILPRQVAAHDIPLSDGGRVVFGQIFCEKPKITPQMVRMTPQMARDSMLTYAADISTDIAYVASDGSRTPIDRILIGKIPVMVLSSLCHLHGKTDLEILAMRECSKDPGGYFVIKGTEKVVLIQEKLGLDKIFVFVGDTKTSAKGGKSAKSVPKGRLVARMTTNTLQGSTVVVLKEGKRRNIKLSLHFMGKNKKGDQNTIGVFQAYRMLGSVLDELAGITDPNEKFSNTPRMIRMISQFTRPEWVKKVWITLQPSLLKLSLVGDDIEYILRKRGPTPGNTPAERRLAVLKLLQDELFPQIEATPRPGERPEETRRRLLIRKLEMLSIMVARMAEVMAGLRPVDDRDDWANKRLETAARSMEQLFHGLWSEYLKKTEETIRNKNYTRETVRSAFIHHSIITDGFTSSFNSNNWGVKGYYKENITDVLKRDNILSTYSNLRRVNTPTSRKAKQPLIRLVQLSQIGYICPVETPEGENCVALPETVLMSDGSHRPMGEVKDGDEIITIDPVTLQQSTTKVYRYFTVASDKYGKKVVQVTSYNGRTYTVTEDHKFLTHIGWVKAEDLDPTEHLVCIWPGVTPVPHNSNERIILSVNEFKNLLSDVHVKPSLFSKHADDLISKGLLPLRSTHPHLPIIARICGFTITDGSLGIRDQTPYSSFCFGTEYDANLFEEDMARLGFNKTRARYGESTMIDKETGRETTHHGWTLSHGACFASLLLALGLIHGRKTESPSKPVPDWIMNGSPLVKREFLAGFQGGDGCKICWHKRYNKVTAGKINLMHTMQHKCPEHVQSLIDFMKQIKQLFAEFNIETFDVVSKQVSETRYMVKVKPVNTEENILRYMDMIGYRYATTKSTMSYQISEYLRYKQNKIKERAKLKAQVLELYNGGMKQADIARKLEMRLRLVGSIIEYDKINPTSKSLAPPDTVSFETWLKCTFINHNCIFMPIWSITEQPPCLVGDFTTVSDNHSFIGGQGFVTHNCGIVKNMTIASYISIQRDENLVLRRILDESANRPQPYLSDIPTTYHTSKFMLNGKFLGWCPGTELRNFCITMRRTLVFPKDTSVVLDLDNFLYIYTNGARPSRPLLIVDPDGELVIAKKNMWQASTAELLSEGCLEYIDPFEQHSILVAQSIWDMEAKRNEVFSAQQALQRAEENLVRILERIQAPGAQPNLGDQETREEAEREVKQAKDVLDTLLRKRPYTHCEMDPSAILGIAASVIPMPEHNQGPRNTFACLPTATGVNIDGKMIDIGDLKNGDEVLTIDPITLKTSKTRIKNHFIINSSDHGKKVYEITTISGRKIQATQDHPFLTLNGWVQAGELDLKLHHLGIYPDVKPLDNNGNRTVLTPEAFSQGLEKLGCRASIIIKHRDELMAMKLLPLEAADDRLPIIARMLGYLQSDGHLGWDQDVPRTQWSFGQQRDAEVFNQDVRSLGFNEMKICESITHHTVSGATYHTCALYKHGSFSTLMMALDGVIGRKTETQSNPIPEWIMTGSPSIKREYVAGFMGGDGTKINMSSRQYKTKRGSTYDLSRMVQHKATEHVDSCLAWFEQFTSLLHEFGIATGTIKVFTSDYDPGKRRIELEMPSDRQNLIRLMDLIGYRYATTKYTESLIVSEWLKYVDFTLSQVYALREMVFNLHNDGWSHPKIAKHFNIPVHKSQDYYWSRLHGKTMNLPQDAIRLEDWVDMVVAKDRCIFEPIRSINEIPGCLVADFETEAETHSFIAGDGFITHNCGQGRQALGIYHSNYMTRFDTTSKMLAFPTRPLFEPQINALMGLNELPTGEMVIVAIMTYLGYNQEDAFIFNKASIDRGLFRMLKTTTYRSALKQTKQFVEEFIRPEIVGGEPTGRYDNIDENGYPRVGAIVKQGDCIIGKVRIYHGTGRTENASVFIGVGEEGIVDDVLITENEEKKPAIKVRIRQMRFPMIGDKFAPRNAQKGTIGIILPEEDMPFIAAGPNAGMRPDIIINPHCLPSRMTMSLVIEIVASKLASIQGERVNASAFRPFDIDEFRRNLKQYGYNEFGNEVMQNGMTGKRFKSQIFIGPCYYQALRHHVQDKIQMRSRGAINPVSHQPVGGRARHGGLRSIRPQWGVISLLVCTQQAIQSNSGDAVKPPVPSSWKEHSSDLTESQSGSVDESQLWPRGKLGGMGKIWRMTQRGNRQS